MNQPPEPTEPAILARMRDSWDAIAPDMRALLRYQPSGGSAEDKAAALRWLSRRGIEASADRLLITPGAHAAMLAVLSDQMIPGQTVCCEEITYPGIRAIAEHLNLRLVGLPCDAEGILPDAFQAQAEQGDLRFLYVNPTLLNPTTHTMTSFRRAELVEIARTFGVEILEDDAYGHLKPNGPPAIAMMAPELTYHVSGLAKTLGAGLRLAYLVAPTPARLTSAARRLRAASVMASPLTTALATRWIETGLADDMLLSVRRESRARQKLAMEILPVGTYMTDPDGFHMWILPPKPWTRHRIADWMRGHALGMVPADMFCVALAPPEALRLCLGGAATREDTHIALTFLAEAFRRTLGSRA